MDVDVSKGFPEAMFLERAAVDSHFMIARADEQT